MVSLFILAWMKLYLQTPTKTKKSELVFRAAAVGLFVRLFFLFDKRITGRVKKK